VPPVLDVVTLALAVGVIVASALLGDGTLARRALAVVAVMLGTTMLVALLLRAIPGDPVESILGEQASPEARAALSQELGLDRGVVEQTAQFVRGSASSLVLALTPTSWQPALAPHLADEPRSFRTREPVRTVVLARLPKTLLLSGAALLLAIVIGVGLGTLAAWRRGRVIGGLAEAFALVGVAMPRFWLAPLLILVFALHLRVVPPSGADEGLRSLILPAISLGTALAALLARMTRSSLLDVLHADYVRTARSKGLRERDVVTKHALRTALLPVITVVGLQMGGLLAGAVITEKVFAWPGVGLLMLDSIKKLDVPVVQGVVLVVAMGTALATLLAEALVRVLDPRYARSISASMPTPASKPET
jgi:peptide/nickel transport system permease protein